MSKKKTKKKVDCTEIIMVLDRSGSMAAVQKDMEGGMNQFITDQKKVKGKANFTMAQFDTVYELVHEGIDIKKVPTLELVPRGATALLDAIGQTITVTKDRLEKNKSKNRVLFIIITDGHENSSHEFTKKQIVEMTKERKEKDNWEFTFLGANQDAIDEGHNIGVGVGQSLTFNTSTRGISNAFASVTSNTASYRSGGSYRYSDKDRKDAVK